MVDGPHVAAVRVSLRRGEPQFRRALTELEADANRGLTVAPMSVMDKNATPPSGDKHDYMSQAPYWWPDPSKPGGKPYIRKDGQRNPEIDKITDRAHLRRLAETSFRSRWRSTLLVGRTTQSMRHNSCVSGSLIGPRE